MVENNFGKGEKAGYQYFFLFPKCFQTPPSIRIVKSQDYELMPVTSGPLELGIVWLS